MTMLAEICGRDVVITTAETTVSQAAKLMRHQHVGSVVVIESTNGDGRKPIGIVTDRDLVVEVMAVDLDPQTITVGDIMPGELVTARADEGALEAMQTMRAKGVRRLPVVDESGYLLGLVAFDDLLEVVTEELSELTHIVRREQARETTTRR